MKRVLLVHNRYQQRGGEDVVFETERDLLSSHGHDVADYVLTNDVIRGPVDAMRASAQAIWNTASHHDVKKLIRDHRPDIVHCINTFPLVSPSVYYAARSAGVPV